VLEVNLGGVFLPAALVWAVVAYMLSSTLTRCLNRHGAYQYVWHRALFDFALFVVLWGGLSALAYHVAFSHAEPG